jgi:hypothetical protein
MGADCERQAAGCDRESQVRASCIKFHDGSFP